MGPTVTLAIASLLAQAAPEFGESMSHDRVGIRTAVWWPDVTGFARGDEYYDSFFVPGVRIKGTRLTLEEDLDLDTHPPVVDVALSLSREFPAGGQDIFLGIELRYWGFRTKGSQVFDSDEVYTETLFAQGTTVESSLSLRRYGVAFAVGASLDRENEWWLGGRIGLHYMTADLKLDGPAVGESDDNSDVQLGLGVETRWRPVTPIHLGLSLSTAPGFQSNFVEGTVSAGASWGPVTFDAGYRFAVWEFDDGTDILHVGLRGPQISVGVRF